MAGAARQIRDWLCPYQAKQGQVRSGEAREGQTRPSYGHRKRNKLDKPDRLNCVWEPQMIPIRGRLPIPSGPVRRLPNGHRR